MVRIQTLNASLIELLLSLSIASLFFLVVYNLFFTLISTDQEFQKKKDGNRIFTEVSRSINKNIHAANSNTVTNNSLNLILRNGDTINYSYGGTTGDPLIHSDGTHSYNIIESVKSLKFAIDNNTISYDITINLGQNSDKRFYGAAQIRKNTEILSWEVYK